MNKKDRKEIKNFLVERSNQFNEYRPCGMSLAEIRFFAIYQARINARDITNTEVILSLNEFINIVELKKLDITWIKNIARDLLRKIITIPNNDGTKGFTMIPLFSKFKVFQRDDNCWYVSIKCSEELMPYIFQMKSHYFKYELWNALRLSSTNQIRMYEILKQYEKIGRRRIDLSELKYQLGLQPTQYPRYYDFKQRVLDPCQQAIEANTDIKFTYTPIKQGSSSKVIAIIFDIEHNNSYKDNLRINEIISQEQKMLSYNSDDYDDYYNDNILSAPIDIYEISSFDEDNSEIKEYLNNIDRLCSSCKYIFSQEQIECLWQLVEKTKINGNYTIDTYILSKYLSISQKISSGEIHDPVAYITKLIDIDVQNIHNR